MTDSSVPETQLYKFLLRAELCFDASPLPRQPMQTTYAQSLVPDYAGYSAGGSGGRGESVSPQYRLMSQVPFKLCRFAGGDPKPI